MPSPGQFLNIIADNIEKAIIGKRKMIDLILISLISKGHIYFGYELFLPVPVTLQRGLEHPRL